MNSQFYLETKINELISDQKIKNYWYIYNLKRLKRFSFQTLISFIFQYLTIIYLTFSYPALPMYPPIGVAFVLFYLFGNNSILGLLLGSLAYLFKGFSTPMIFCYALADIGCGWLGAMLCLKVFSSDLMRVNSFKEWARFIKINMCLCLVSSLLRITGAVWEVSGPISFNIVFYYVDLWLADLNSIVIMFGFFVSWLYLMLSREQAGVKKIAKIPVIAVISFVILAVIFMKKAGLIYLIIFAMLCSVYGSFVYGSFVAAALLYIVSIIYLTYFLAHKQAYLVNLGLPLYTTVPIFLFIYTVVMIYLGCQRQVFATKELT